MREGVYQTRGAKSVGVALRIIIIEIEVHVMVAR